MVTADFLYTVESFSELGANYQFTDASFSSEIIDLWVWEVLEPGESTFVFFSDSQNPLLNSLGHGEYTVRLTVFTVSDASDSIEKVISVELAGATPVYTPNPDLCVSEFLNPADVSPNYARSCSACLAQIPTPTSIFGGSIDRPVTGTPVLLGTPSGGGFDSTVTPAPTNTPSSATATPGVEQTVTIQGENAAYWSGGVVQTGAGRTFRAFGGTNDATITLLLPDIYLIRYLELVLYHNATGTSTTSFLFEWNSSSLTWAYGPSSSGWFTRRVPGLPELWDEQITAMDITALNGQGVALDAVIVHYLWTMPIPDATPTPTLAPTATPNFDLAACQVPELIDHDSLIVDMPDTLIIPVGQTCYTFFPGLNLDLTGVGLGSVVVPQVQLCIDWYQFAGLNFFGFAFGVDFFLIFPLAWLIRRLLSF